MELVISIVLISVVLIFLMRLLVDLNNTETNNSYAKDNQIIRSEVIRTIENDFNSSLLTGINDQSNSEALKVEFSFSDGTSFLEVKENSVTYTTIDKKTRTWTIKDGTIYPNKASVNILKQIEEGSDEGVYVLEINIEVHTSNDLNKLDSNNILDDITISYVGRYKRIEGNLSCLGYECDEKQPIKIEVSEKPTIDVLTTTSTYNSINVNVTANSNDSVVTKYYYSINNGDYVEDSSSSYTFTGLFEQTTYTIKAKVMDANNKESAVYKTTATTSAYKMPTIAITSIDSTANTIIVNVSGINGDGKIKTYYYSKDNGSSYEASTNSSYTFNGVTSNTKYNIKVYAVDVNGKKSNEVTGDIVTKKLNDINIDVSGVPSSTGKKIGSISCSSGGATYSQLYNRVEISSINNEYETCTLTYTESSSKAYLNNYIISLSGTTQGTGKVVSENGYRYEGKNPNNYVWFNDELWRIIGVFDSSSHGQSGKNLVKLVRSEPIGNFAWEGYSTTSDWSNSYLYNLLNGSYYNSEDSTNTDYCHQFYGSGTGLCDFRTNGIKTKYKGMIENVTWYLGGITTDEAAVGTYYTEERGTNVYSSDYKTSTSGYVGLMYPSDYGYATLSSSCARTTLLSDYLSESCAGKNWMAGHGITTISSLSSSTYRCIIAAGGKARDYTRKIGVDVSPVVYLNSSVYVTGGNGSISNPYQIGL